jgi:type II secretory pathway component PulF
MKDFMEKYGSEVLNMLNVEFNLEDALAVRYEEGREEGREKGIRKLAELIQKGYPLNDALELISREKRLLINKQ